MRIVLKFKKPLNISIIKMIDREFRNLLNSLTSEEIIELHMMDPYFLEIFCYMLTLELQINRENLQN